MLTVHRLIWFLAGRNPIEFVVGVALVSVAGVVAAASISALAQHRRDARALGQEGLLLALALVAFCASDWALLQLLPHLRLSFSPDVRLPLLASLFVRTLIFWGMLAAVPLARGRRERAPREARRKGLILSPLVAFLAANLAFSAVQVDAYVVEPLAVETTRLTLTFDDLEADAPPLRVVQLTDTHIERSGPREAAVVRKVNALKPDIIVLTGDYLNLSYLADPISAAHFRRFVAQLQAPYGIYAVRGSVEPTPESMAQLVAGTGVIWLEQEAVTVDVRGQSVTLVGVACSHQQGLDTARLAETTKGLPADVLTVLLYHSPDLIHEAAGRGIDLYLAGHTHGGQIRLPFYGAVVSGSMYGRRYVSGLFTEDTTTMVVSRGIGFEGGGLPRARFLCPPEIVSIDLVGK